MNDFYHTLQFVKEIGNAYGTKFDEGDKLQFIHFGKLINCQMKEFRLQMWAVPQSIQTAVKLLGIELDSNLTFNKEIEKIIAKMRSLPYVISFFITEINVANAKNLNIWPRVKVQLNMEVRFGSRLLRRNRK
ncbi:unnamed protein product [Ambrosiozyma monospora]|uniref:Unnamed protein product n=1 Tax=Ambrosiozyma monospora TaxID=43982 RepID=A0A9W6WK61_AMBMO|nr:unnamed protein product [Ambrosiozyma monospora]